MAQISYHAGSNGIYVHVDTGAHTYLKRLDDMSAEARGKTVNALREWNRKGAVGFPPL